MMLWALLALMCLVAIAFAIWPLLKDLPRRTLLAGVSIVFITASAAGLYSAVGSPHATSGASQTPDVTQMVTSLAERLQGQPDDVNGWKMLGRSYMTMGNYDEAARAFDRAVQLESARNAQTLVALGVALTEGNGRQITSQAVSVFENALRLEPNNPEALFWGGLGAFNSGNSALAADRWELLLATNPPPEVRNIVRQRIALWRGENTPADSAPVNAMEAPASVITANVSLSDEAKAALPKDASIFIIARDPAQPSPPIAVTRRSLSELPLLVELGDRESMIPGRNLSAFVEFEMVARVSVSGNPGARSGDWFTSSLVRPAESRQVELTIDQQVQ
jgi:cytochrome c-type biogenesis protein CcmH